jgi:hypothetical protein
VEAKTWPRHRYWDVFAHRVSAATIHFEDDASLAAFKCPDGSHLDVSDARRFTGVLLKILAAKNLIQSRVQSFGGHS